MPGPKDSATTKLLNAIYSRYPLLYVATWEEERLEQVLRQISRTVYKDERPVVLWSTGRGYKRAFGRGPIFGRTKQQRDLLDERPAGLFSE